jgi:hypothetical protein
MNTSNVIYSTNIGFEFEFFSKFDMLKTKQSISETLNKKIKIEDKAHSEFSPTSDVFKMEPDNSGGTGMIELVTGSTPFPEAKLILAKMLKWISTNGSTNDRCSIHINISFDKEKIGHSFNISNLNIGKFVLSFDEDKVYELFPNRKNSVYAKSIKWILPTNSMSLISSNKIIWHNFIFVNNKYYGINFTKLPKGYIEFRYLGGKDYEKQYDKIYQMIEHFIMSLYSTLENAEYTQDELKEIDIIIQNYHHTISSCASYENFIRHYDKIKLMVDLDTSEKLVKSYFPIIKSKILDLILKCKLEEGFINYDSDIGKLQIKDMDLENCFEIIGIDIVDSKVRGNIINCDIFDSEILDSSLLESNLFGQTVCKKCKIEHSYVSKNVTAEDCYVFGRRGVFSGEMSGGIFREGRATELAKFSKETEVIEIEKIKI